MLGLLVYVVLLCGIHCHAANVLTTALNQKISESVHTNETSISMNSTSAGSPVSKSPTPTSSSSGKTDRCSDLWPDMCRLLSNNCYPVLMVTGGLLLACTILLLSTLLLALKACLLSKRLSALSSIGSPGYAKGSGGKSGGLSETELWEDGALMADRLHEGKGGAREEEGDEEEGEKEGEKEEEGKVEEAPRREEASPQPAETSTSAVPQEVTAKTDTTSGGTEEPKDAA